MNRDMQTIERIVAEVVRRLSQMADGAPANKSVLRSTTDAPAAATAKSPAPPKTTAGADTLVLDARVVTTATIHGRLKGIRRVLVGTSAVVTPSVKDELRKRNIRLECEDAEPSASGSGDVAIVRCTRLQDATRAVTTLPMPADVVQQTCEDLTDAVTRAANNVECPERVSVLVTDDTLAAVCLLNRMPHVRAAQARTVDETRQAIAAIGANVLVVDPRMLTSNQWSVIVKAFRQKLPRSCPPLL